MDLGRVRTAPLSPLHGLSQVPATDTHSKPSQPSPLPREDFSLSGRAAGSQGDQLGCAYEAGVSLRLGERSGGSKERAGAASPHSPLHLPPSPAARLAGPYPGHHEAAFPSRSRPHSGGQSLPFSSPPASYPAGACPGGRPFIHRAAAPAEATKPAWQREAPRSSGRRLRLLTFTRRPRLRHPASFVGPGAVETAGRRSPPSSSSSSRPAPPRPAEGRRLRAGRSRPVRLCWVPPQLLASRQLRG